MIKITKDISMWEAIKKDLLKANQENLKVGFFEDARYGPENDNLQVAQVAQWNEEGSVNNPTRPFIRMGFMPLLSDAQHRALFQASIDNVIQGKSTFKAEYNKLGPVFVRDMKKVITDWDTPPNSQATQDEKGRNDPLVWTGLMRDSVDYKVERGDD